MMFASVADRGSQYLQIPRRFTIDSWRFSISPDSDLQIPCRFRVKVVRVKWTMSRARCTYMVVYL